MEANLRVLCILNPTSGNGMGRQRWPEVEAIMKSFGLSCELMTVDSEPLGDAVCRRLQGGDAARYGAICGIGGDGTHSQVINGLMRFRAARPHESLPPYALIPLGTGNDIAKSFGLTGRNTLFESDLRRAVSAIQHGADYFLDVGKMGPLYFVDALTIGLDSHVLREHNRHKEELGKHPFLSRIIRGNLLYTWCLGLRLRKHEPVQAKIIIDGKPWYRGELINLIVNNTRVYGGEFVICPDSFANDGLLEVVVFEGHYDYLARYLLALRANPLEIQRMARKLATVSKHAQGRKIGISLSRSESAQYDGEMLPPGREYEIEVVPRAIRIKVPAEPG